MWISEQEQILKQRDPHDTCNSTNELMAILSSKIQCYTKRHCSEIDYKVTGIIMEYES
jgi:hypothetical protein